MPRDVIQARLQLAEVLDELLTAGEYQMVDVAIQLVREDLRVLSRAARRKAPRKVQRTPQPEPTPRSDSSASLDAALAKINAFLELKAAHKAQAEAAENVTFLSAQLEKRRRRERERSRPVLRI